MLVGLLLVALYTALSLGSARQPGLPSLSPGDRRTLHAEYFLQSLFQNIASQPKILLAKVRSTELANLAQTHLTETRTKRAARGPPPNPCTTSEGENQLDQHCCLDTVEIDFHQIGWNFILSPRKIQYSFCRGSCNPQVIRPALFTRAASQILYVCINFKPKSASLSLVFLLFLSVEAAPAG